MKVLRYCEILQRGGAFRYIPIIPMFEHCTASNLHWHTRQGRAWLRGGIGSHQVLMLYRPHNTATDRRCPMLHSSTSPVRKQTRLTTGFSSLNSMWQPSTTLQNRTPKTGRRKPRKHLKGSWNMYSSGLPRDTKPLRSCSENRPKMLLKSHLLIICH